MTTRLTVVLVVSSLMAVSSSPADAGIDDRAVTISAVADISTKRQAIIDFIWGPEGFPSSAMPSSVTLNAQSPVSGLSNLSRVDKLAIGMDAGQEGLAYHFIPQRQNRRLVVVHNGHACSFDDDAGFTDEGLGFHRTISGLLTDGYSVLAVYMPFLNHLNCGYHIASHDDLFSDPQYAPSSGSPLQYFLEPVAVSLNYLRTRAAADGFPVYQDFSMVGLSGGGWTTTVYAAIDSSISVSFPVAGRMPLYSAPYGDTEQSLDAFYQIAGYPDLYLLGSYGNGRKQVWILNRRDNCCFGERPDLYQDPSGRTWEQVVRAYEYDVRLALYNLGSTGFFRLEIDEAAPAHTLSWNSVVNQILAELNDGRRYIGASSSENAFVRGLSGTLWHYGPAGWVNTGCPMAGVAAVVEGAVNVLDVFYRDAGNRLMHAFTNGAGWSCLPVSGIVISDPVVVSTAPGSYDIVAFGRSYCLYRWHGTASGIEPYQGLPCGIGLGTPSVVSPGPNQLSVFFRGFDRALYHAYFTGGGPWQLEMIGGIMLDFPTAIAMPDGSLRAYVRGQSGQLWEAQAPHQGGAWKWSSISAQVGMQLIEGSPSASKQGNAVRVHARQLIASISTFTFNGTWEFANNSGRLTGSPTSVWGEAWVRGMSAGLWKHDGTSWLGFSGLFD